MKMQSHVADAAYLEAKAAGWGMLQPVRYAGSDREHVAMLLAAMDPVPSARVLDVGCGTGDVAKLMVEQRPDIEFDLLNFSEEQLLDCPHGMRRWLADAHGLPFDDETFDAVMFNFALGNMDWRVALAEAMRVLRPGGQLFINELFARDTAVVERLGDALFYRPMIMGQLSTAVAAFGGENGGSISPSIITHYLRDRWHGPKEEYDQLFAGAVPTIYVATKVGTTVASRMGSAFGKHERVALQVSGGKDSLVCLHLLSYWHDRLTVYWTNPGNPLPETVELMRKIAASVPNFKEVAGRQREIIAADGWPSDVVPQRYTTDGNAVFGPTTFKVQTRLSCCYRSLMEPMHQAALTDGVTCIIRGKRREEADKTGLEDGHVEGGIELRFPIIDWSEGNVFAYMRRNGIEPPPYYEHAKHSLDCLDCTAWWGEGLANYLKHKHPGEHAEYVRRIGLIKKAVAEQLAECEV